MQTIKTAVVVVLLLFVLYGGFVAMNGTDTPLKVELELGQLDTFPDVTGPSQVATSIPSNASNAFEMFNNTPSKGFAASTGSSPFPAATLPPSDSVVPPIAFPSSANSTLQPAPMLIPSGLPSDSSTSIALPPLASTPSTNFNSSLPLSSEEKLPLSTGTTNTPISTNTPSFGMAVPGATTPLSSQPSLSAVTPLPMVDLPKQAGLNPLSPPSIASPAQIKSSASKAYENAKDLAMEQIDRRNLKDALATLSVFYNASELTTEQRQDLLDLLDALAREVVFSRQHTLDMAYVVAPGETLEQIAKRCDLPTEILARINALDVTAPVRSGEKLKVVPGPFRAEVDMARNELTLFLGDLYAGRYPVTFGSEPSPQPGVFQVVGKQKNRNYYGSGVQIQANDPRNPFGGYWIDLGQDLCIHGSSNSGPAESKLGCISLSPLDANDVFGMLSSGSQVTIRR